VALTTSRRALTKTRTLEIKGSCIEDGALVGQLTCYYLEKRWNIGPTNVLIGMWASERNKTRRGKGILKIGGKTCGHGVDEKQNDEKNHVNPKKVAIEHKNDRTQTPS